MVTEFFAEHENDLNHGRLLPDLNPNEHLWEILERSVRPRFPPPTKHQIMDFLVEDWCRI